MSNRERYELKRQEKLQAESHVARKQTLKRIARIAVMVLIVGGGLGGLIWYIANQPKTPESEIISQNGIHWHSHLAIFIKGKPQEIPANLGIGIRHEPIHTHDTTGQLHLEIQGLTTKSDTTLGRFFKIWGKDFMEFGSAVSMTVNGEENTDFANYEMKDGDKIELKYE